MNEWDLRAYSRFPGNDSANSWLFHLPCWVDREPDPGRGSIQDHFVETRFHGQQLDGKECSVCGAVVPPNLFRAWRIVNFL